MRPKTWPPRNVRPASKRDFGRAYYGAGAQCRRAHGRRADIALDEVAAHLDATRRQALFEILQDLGGQSWITGTDATAFADFTHATSHLHIAAGAVLPGPEVSFEQSLLMI